MTAMKINEQIAFLRKQRGLTQEALANALGVTNQAVSKWESAQCCPDICLLPRIADCFGVSIDELMGHSSITGNDSLVEKALSLLSEKERISTSMLQMHLNIGYSKARNLIRQLETDGQITPSGKWSYILRKQVR